LVEIWSFYILVSGETKIPPGGIVGDDQQNIRPLGCVRDFPACDACDTREQHYDDLPMPSVCAGECCSTG
jgi:hypothetical protein